MERKDKSVYPGALSQLVKIFSILIVAGVISFLLIYFQKAPKKFIQPALQSVVDVVEISSSSGPMTIEAMGNIQAERSYEIVSEVAGRVEWINPKLIPGGRFKKGAEMLRIEKTDYEIALQQAVAAVADAKKTLLQEEGRARYQRLIEKDRKTKSTPEAKSLRLREPQIIAANANVKAAEKALEQARRDLRRTTVKAPFDLIITEKNIELGKYVGRLSKIGTAMGTDRFWAVVSLPVSKAKFLSIPGVNTTQGKGSKAQIITRDAAGNNSVKDGQVLRLLGELDGQGRMAQILVAVDDPMGLKNGDTRNPLLVNAYVRVLLEGNNGVNTVKVPRQYVHEGNTVWVMNPEGRLEIRPVTIAWTTRDDMFVSKGLQAGEKIITNRNFVPIEGMTLTVAGSVTKDNPALLQTSDKEGVKQVSSSKPPVK